MIALTPPAAVLFDCDGVIVDSEPITNRIIADNLARHGLPMTPAAIQHDFVGGTMAQVRDHAIAKGAALPRTWLADIHDAIYARLALGTPLVPGIADVMDRLDAAGIAYAVGSNGTGRKMQATLGQHPAIRARLKGRLFSGQDLGCPKPDPGLYLHAARALGVPPSRCVVIEDSATGARAARAADMACFGYAPDGDGAALADAGARLFTRMTDLPGLLGL